MSFSFVRPARTFAALAAALGVLSCADNFGARGLAPRPEASSLASVSAPTLVISQVYGGGGNANSVYKNDFIEIFNPGSSAVSLAGWSVQYASSSGTSWQATALSGTIQAGGYYLVQEAAGGGGTTALPTPDVTGGINMSASAGKVVLVQQAAALASGTACPTGGTVVDFVPFGSGNCSPAAPGTTTNTVSVQRNTAGCAYTGNPSTDFAVATTAPRNSATTHVTCGTAAQPVAAVAITPDSTGVLTGATVAFTANALDALGNPTTTTFTWTSTAPSVATVDGNGNATGVGDGLALIIATSANGVADTSKLSVKTPVIAAQPGDVVISQVYGAGGNANAVYTNDFIEVFNRTTHTIDLSGWSVQYASATGTSWQVSPISGSIPAGGYYLVQEGAGSGGTTPLPTPDATGAINLSGTAGKVAVVATATALSGACPTGGTAMDVVGYGTTSCATSALGPTANTLADQRKSGGCFLTGDASSDFILGSAAPRNSASPARSCVVGPLDHVTVTGNLTVIAGSTTQLTATPLDANENIVTNATFAWSSGNTASATVSNTGLVSGVAASAEPVVITVTATAAGVSKSSGVNVQVNNEGINWVDVSSSSASFPAGFQTQLFATARTTQGGTVIPATFTFETVDPQIATVATVQNTGIVTGVAPPADGTTKPGIKITATPTAGGTPYTFISRPVTIETPTLTSTSNYGNNDEMGDPTSASTSNPNDFLIRRTQYVLSYNQSRGTPNWVAYELDARQMVTGQDRCNCFTADPLLPADKQIFTSDYTNGGFDRGHMTRSADRTLANGDNAATFYLTNVVPQQADLNQGVWAQFENALADSARAGRAVYIVTGPIFGAGHAIATLKGEGKVAIPDSTFKVALIGPMNAGVPFTRDNVQSFGDLTGLTLMAVNMPNVSGVRNDPWAKYLTTVDKIEASTGFDFLSLLQTAFQPALDYKDHAPHASFTMANTGSEGAPVAFDASASTDADSARTDLGGRHEGLTFAWHFSDGTDATGKTVSHTFAGHGTFTATLTVTDVFGWPDSLSQTVAVANVAPTATLQAPTTGSEGSAFTVSLANATDPSPADAAALTFAFDCGAGYGTASPTASTTCTPANNGDVTVKAKVIDPSGAFTEYTQVVAVANVPPTAVLSAPSSGTEGASFTISLTSATDASPVDAAALLFAFDCGTGYGTPSSSPTATCTPADNGDITVHAKVIDPDGAFSAYSNVIHVANVAPTATFTAPSTIIRGTSFTLSLGDAVDPSTADVAAGLQYSFDCGDGAGYRAASTSASVSCTASTTGTHTVRGKIADKDGGSTEYTAALRVDTDVIAALVRHAPTLNASVTGSVQMMSGENVAFNGGGTVTGSLLVPGTPTVRQNGRSTFGGTSDGTGSSTPANYTITLNNGATLGSLVRRTDAVTLPTVAAPAAPQGTRTVSLNKANDDVGSWSTLRNLTLNGSNLPTVTMPAGAYGDITINGNNTIVLGVAGATQPSVYDFQHLTLNSNARLVVAGPVILTVGGAVSVNGPIVGASDHPEWLTFKLSQGGLTLNSNVSVYGVVFAPNGTVTVNSGSTLTGGLAADGLTLSGGSSNVRITIPISTP